GDHRRCAEGRTGLRRLARLTHRSPQSRDGMIRVLLVDDQELVRAGLRRILQTTDDVEVAAECADGSEVPWGVAEHAPDVIVMDIRMKDVDGVEATRRLRERDDAPPVLVLTTFDDDELLSGALR